MEISRVFSMPAAYTFTMKPVQELLREETKHGFWVDSFAGYNSVAHLTNDLDEDAPTDYHMSAIEFCDNVVFDGIDGVLFDPPYSAGQIVEMYKKSGQDEWKKGQVQGWVKNLLAPKLVLGGIAICFGWNSNGFGKSRGFQMEKVLLIQHGGSHNDTIVTVERKIKDVSHG